MSVVGRDHILILSYICQTHESMKQQKVNSPCRGKCRTCGLKNVFGYNNPDHTCNPFGYLYLVPLICYKCALHNKQCMWCDPNNG